MPAPYEFDPNATKPRQALAITTLRRSSKKSIDPAIVEAAIKYLHKKGKSYDFLRRQLVHSGHTNAEAVTLCDACLIPPAP